MSTAVNRWTPNTQQTMLQPLMPGRVELKYELGKDLIPIHNKSEIVHVLLEIKTADLLKKLTCLNICIVIDHSNSMDSAQFKVVRDAAKLVIDRMEPTDYISFVISDDNSSVIIPSMPCNDKLGLKAAIDRIRYASGELALSLGIILGLNELRRSNIPNASSHLILLTNGMTNYDAERCRQLARDAASTSIRIHPFGANNSWNISLLAEISQLSNGIAPVLLSPNTDVLHLLDAGGNSASSPIVNMAVHNAKLTLNFPSNVSLRRAAQVQPVFAAYDQPLLTSGKVPLTLGNLEESTTYEYLFEAIVTPQSSGSFRLAQAELSYDMPFIGITGEKEYYDLMVHFMTHQGQPAQINLEAMNKIIPILSKLH